MNRALFTLGTSLVLLMIAFSGCQSTQTDYCVVEGNIKGLSDGTRLELQDGWNRCKVVGTAVVEDGKFEFHPKVTAPTHVYMYQGDLQLQDFILEPGTIVVDVNAEEGDEYSRNANGTPSNDFLLKYNRLRDSGQEDSANAMVDSVLTLAQTGPLAVLFADRYYRPSNKVLDALDRLSPDLASLPFVAALKEELSILVKTEPRDDYKPHYIDLEFCDIEGNPVSLSSVVDNPKSRYVLLDFWATWCGPCVKYLPQLKEVYAKYHEKGLEIYSVSIDSSKSKWESFLKENGNEWINVLDNKGGGRKSKVWETYAVNIIPMFLLIDGNTGEILFRENHPDLEAIFGDLFLRYKR